MSPVIETLLQIVKRDPYPAPYISSYWQQYGAKNLVEFRANGPVLQGYGIGSVNRPGVFGRALHVLERISYRRLTDRLGYYPTIWRSARQLAEDLSFGLTFDVWKCAVVLAVLADHWTLYGLSPKTFALIGDGYGFLGALIRRYLPGIRIYCIDLPKTLVFQARTHEIADREATMSVLPANGGPTEITFVLPQNVGQIADDIDCGVNIASMQEMNKLSIETYFTFLRRCASPQSRFYCVNRLRKELPGGEVSAFYDYPWRHDDEIFIDEPCPYYTHFFAPYTVPNGPKMLGIRIPWIYHFDGIHMHRLVRLAPLDWESPSPPVVQQ